MKWLFATLVALNVVVFASMIGYKLMTKNNTPVVAQTNQSSLPPQVIINNTGTPTLAQSPTQKNTTSTAKPVGTPRVNTPSTNNNKNNNKNNNTLGSSNTERANAQYKACSATVSIPEDDYHRIKGLLARFPHAATRQVVENTQANDENQGRTRSNMNILFMSVNDQDASAIQGIVGRYGKLRRSSCNK